MVNDIFNLKEKKVFFNHNLFVSICFYEIIEAAWSCAHQALSTAGQNCLPSH